MINDQNFNGNELLNTFQTMTKEQAIDLLGEKYSKILLEKLNNHTLTFDELESLCDQAYPTHKQRAHWIRNIIHSKLDKYERLSIYGVSQEQIALVKKMDDYKEKVDNRTITKEELRELCNIVFDQSPQIRKTIYQQMSSKIDSKKK